MATAAPEIGAGRLLITYGEAATALAISPRFLRMLVYQGVIPSVKLGRLRRIATEDLAAFVEQLRDVAAPRTLPAAPMRASTRRSSGDLNPGSRMGTDTEPCACLNRSV